MPREKVLWIREPYLNQILSGHKTVEVRVAYSNIARLEAGDYLRLNNRHRVRLRRIGHYISFKELLEAEDPTTIAPDLFPEELEEALREIYPAEKELLGVVALEVELLDKADGGTQA